MGVSIVSLSVSVSGGEVEDGDALPDVGELTIAKGRVDQGLLQVHPAAC